MRARVEYRRESRGPELISAYLLRKRQEPGGHDPVPRSPVSGVAQPLPGVPDERDAQGAKTPLTYC
jgi:hypothetical protein